MRRPALIMALILTGSMLQLGPVAAQPDPAAEPAAVRSPITHQVTLVTGDQVEYTDSGDGRRAVAVHAAPRPAGTPVTFETIGGRDDFLVIPSDAARYLVSGVLDRDLFNVASLVRDGLDDGSTVAIPVLVDYVGEPDSPSLSRQAAGLPGATRIVPVPAAGMAGVRVAHDRAAQFWQAIAPPRPTAALAGGVERIRLDRTVRVALDQSVPLIGAPAAWAAGLDGTGVTVGVVDTGIDADHPDLAGKVVDSANFTEEPDVRDTNGHGTHVAATVAGTGGRFRGVAPGARLAVAKVFDASGEATESQVMAGMEWAATHGAKIVNLSLGSGPTDGTDPVSALVDELTAKTGTLFVVASGNLGGDRSVTAPGAATSALTVGATDKRDVLAAFSGKGPRLGDAAVKPEIVAPGVAITAARAAGTSMGLPVDERHTTASGTSMATPHVAGAAAIVAQQHPDWPAARLKDAIVSAAKDVGRRWFEQGTGRLDVTRAVRQRATATAALNVGRLPRTGGPATASVTYINDAAEPLRLRLTQAVHGWDGKPAEQGAVRLDTTSIAVPARGRASVRVTVDPRIGATGVYGGVLTATSADGSSALRTAVGYYVPTPTGTLTVTARNSGGQLVNDRFAAVLNESAGTTNDPLGPDPLQLVPLGAATEVPQGTYSVSSSVREASLTSQRWSALAATSVAVTGASSASTVALDARTAVPIGVTAPRPTVQRDHSVALRRQLPGTSLSTEWQFVAGAQSTWRLYASPAAPARTGTVSLQDFWTLSEPQLTMRANGRGRPMVPAPVYDASTIGQALPGTRTLRLVWADQGRPEDFARVDVRGTLALIAIPDPGPVPDPITATFQAARSAAGNAAAAGAAATVVYVNVPGALPIVELPTTPIAQLSLNQAEGEALRGMVAAGPVTVELTGRPAPGYMYNLSYNDTNGIPADHVRRVNQAALVAIDSTYHADRADIRYRKRWTAYPPARGGIVQRGTAWTGPGRWTEYVGPVDARVPWQRVTVQTAVNANGSRIGELAMFGENVFRPQQARSSTEDWFGGPLRNGALTLRPDHPFRNEETTGPGWVRQCAFCRGISGNPDRFVPALHWLDGAGHFVTIWQNGQQYFRTTTVRLFRDGQEIPRESTGPFALFPTFVLPADPGRYRMTMVDAFPATQLGGPSTALFRLAPRTETTWEFTSRRPVGSVAPGYGCAGPCAVQPLIQLDLRPNLDLNNQAPAGRIHRFLIRAGHRDGTDGGAALVNLTMRYSTDEGATWAQARVHNAGSGFYLITVEHPPLAATSGYVWLHTHAWDTAGNWVDQTTQRAYALRD